ncbi:hypothetical protein [Niveispirillum sp. BGYR6]|uniref:DarT1-associated NADAR antitoxin family protein n=1 Tax=Niveispirillum sp. BGYR6 TaxID=2971249 RepID=UPI0022B9BC7F|nr:hypothetical protein [Niveispirillum sp. BGYR6]MDG5494912.1 hypothetical protein [Niveispirillum sp. BGYR6]
MSIVQKKKNIHELHDAAAKSGYSPLLEISTKSEATVGVRLSAFSLKYKFRGSEVPLEAIFQGSKVFENGGPFHDIYEKTAIEAKKDIRIRNHGKIVYFNLYGDIFPNTPLTSFYDWVYAKCLYPHADWLRKLHDFAGFTDIEFNPEKSLNCQARSFAIFIALQKLNLLEEAMGSFERFVSIVYQGDPTTIHRNKELHLISKSV